MEILYDEMHFEVLRHLDLFQLLKISRLSKKYNGYILNKKFWNIYLKYKTQAEYRKILYKISKHGSIELFKILSTSFNNKIVEKYMYGRTYFYASIYDNKPIIEYVEHRIEHKSREGFEFIIEKVIKKAKSNFTQENAIEIRKYMRINSLLKNILSNCQNYETLFRYLNVLKINVHTFIDIDFIERLTTGGYKHAYDLFIGIIEAGIININNLRNETFINECSDKRICDYLIDKGLITFGYESIKNGIGSRVRFPLCEYYIIKLYEEVLDLYKNKRTEEEYSFIWKLIKYSPRVIEDQDIIVNMVKKLCDLKYSRPRLLELILISDEFGQDYLTINLKSIKLQYDLN